MKYNLIVIGGGPAGMMAAGRAAENGASVLLLEKNDSLGCKLLITGKGRCNITHNEFNNRDLISVFGENSDFLFSSFSKFAVPETLDFFNSRGLETKVERGDRIFPVSDRSEDVLQVLIDYMKKGYVKVQTKAEVTEIASKDNKIEKVEVEYEGRYKDVTSEVAWEYLKPELSSSIKHRP
jgi:predicted Rossmann fold flavoprotein